MSTSQTRQPSPRTRQATFAGLALAIALLISGCGSTHLASEGKTARHASSGNTTQQEASTKTRQGPYTVQRLDRQVYTPADWPEALGADVYLPETPGTALRPAALVVHGGGWQNRGPEDMDSIAEQLAARGYVAVNIAHRFAPHYRFPAQLHDLQKAMAWLHQESDAWRVDTDRIVGVGYSSGAHLVGLLALMGSEGLLAEPYGGAHTRLAAVLAGGIPSDLFKFADGRLVVDFIGGTRAQRPDAYALASPARQVTSDAPPFFLFHGAWDQLVPVDHAKDFYQVLQDNEIESELYLQRLRGHFASFLTRGSAMDAGMAFLDRQVNGH